MTDNNLRRFHGGSIHRGPNRSLAELLSIHQVIGQIRTTSFLIVLGAFLSLPAMPVAICEAASHSIRVEARVLPRPALRAQQEWIAAPATAVQAGTPTLSSVHSYGGLFGPLGFRILPSIEESKEFDPQRLLQGRIEWMDESQNTALVILEFSAN